VLAPVVPVSVLAALEVPVAFSAAPPDLFHNLGLPVGVVTSDRAVHGAHWLNHLRFAFGSVNAEIGFFLPMPWFFCCVAADFLPAMCLRSFSSLLKIDGVPSFQLNADLTSLISPSPTKFFCFLFQFLLCAYLCALLLDHLLVQCERLWRVWKHHRDACPSEHHRQE
jgi:hypothetical protein